MSKLSQETIDRIKVEAEQYADQFKHGAGYREPAYADGATEWAGRAEGLTEFIEYVINFPPAMTKSAMSEWVEEVRTWGRTALVKYKEVGNG